MRHIRHVSLTVFLVIVLRSLSLGQDAQGVDQATTVANPLAKVVSALGLGSGTLPTSVTYAGVATQYSAESSSAAGFRIEVSGTDKFRWDADIESGPLTFVVNGASGQLQTATSTTPLAPGEILDRGYINFPHLAILRWAGMNANQIQDMGVEDYYGSARHHFAILAPTSTSYSPLHPSQYQTDRFDLYLDTNTFLPVGITYYQAPLNSGAPEYQLLRIPVDILFADYRDAGGMVVPFTATRYALGRRTNTFQMESIQLNSAIAAQDFTLR